MITILGAVFVLLVACALVLRREWLPWILSAAVPFSATAGFTVAGQSIVIYHVVAIVVVVVAVQRYRLAGILAADLSVTPGLRPLLAFGAWTLAVTALVPTVFAGTKVIDPRRGIDVAVKAPSDLAPSISNFAQAGYLLIGIATVVALASMRDVSPRLPAAAFAMGTLLSSLHSLLPDSANAILFDNSANVAYTTGKFDGAERMRGIFSEPSALGAFSLAATVFFLLSASQAKGWTRAVFLVLALWALANAMLSFSGGALLSGFIVLALVAVERTYAYFRGRLPLSPAGMVGVIFVCVLVVVVGPAVYSFSATLFTDKTDSSSYENRTAADEYSYGLVGESVGLGVGVGSNRPSSFLASLLSTAGVPGAALFACAVIALAVHTARRPEYQPVVASLVSVLISKAVAGPDMSEPVMWFLLGICASGASRLESTTVDRARRAGLQSSSSQRLDERMSVSVRGRPVG